MTNKYSEKPRITFQRTLFGPQLPSLETIAKDFYKKNNLPKLSIQETEHGIIMNFNNHYKNNLCLLSVDYTQDGTIANPSMYIGGNGGYASDTGHYILEGKIKNKKIKLEAKITRILDFKPIKKENKGFCNCVPKEIITYEPDWKNIILNTQRIDKENYWFITEPKKNNF